MIGEVVSHYRVVGRLGAGGMGVVYQAEDLRLGRAVALKFLSEDVTPDAAALERFRVEARAASSLSHPHICTIYDIGEHGGRPFIVMELMRGETLRERLASGPLKVHDVLDLGIQLADALEAAHGLHIVHRDIKPGNVFITTRGEAKILDFGLAKVVSPRRSRSDLSTTTAPLPPPAEPLTAAGLAIGTVSYMSPEQARGDDLDARTDIFSLGLVLYEMVTGHPAFSGRTTVIILDLILNRAPTPPIHINPELPVRLQRVIINALEKDRELRYQTAADLRADLKRVKRDLESGADKSHAFEVTTEFVPPELPGRPSTSGRAAEAVASASTVRPPSGATVVSEPGTGKRSSRGVAAATVLAVGLGLAYFLMRGGAPEPAPVQDTVPTASATPTAPATEPATVPQPEPVQPAAPPASTAPEPVASSPVETRPAPSRTPELRVQPREPVRPAAPPARAANPATGAAPTPPVRAAEPAPAPLPAPADPTPVRPEPATAAPTPVPQSEPPRPVTPPVEPAPSKPAPQPEPAAAAPPPAPAPKPAPPPEPPPPSDEVLIRRVLATYERAIESKDLALFRSVKPNLTTAETNRLQASFHAVTSQEVDLSIIAIDVRGRDASVRVQRRDTIVVDGRPQRTDTVQVMHLTKHETGWVLVDIGR